MNEVPFYYLSARAYAEQTGIGVAEVVKQFNSGNLEGFKTNGQYKIKSITMTRCHIRTMKNYYKKMLNLKLR